MIAVGARFDDRATGKAAVFCSNAQIIHIEIEPAELDKIETAYIGITADVQEELGQLLPQVAENARKIWVDRIGTLKAQFPIEMRDADNPRSHFGLGPKGPGSI